MKKLVPLLVFAVACGPSADGDVALRSSHACLQGYCDDAGSANMSGDAGIGNQPLEPWPDETAGLLSGVYALHAAVVATIGPIMVSFQLLYRVRILQETTGKANVRQSTSLCTIKLPSVPHIATLTIPPRLEALIPVESDVDSSGNFLSMNDKGEEVYDPPPLLTVLGANLAHPATDMLPTMADLTGEVDEDGDGHPGVTVDATVFTCTSPQQLYIAIRAGGTVKGTFQGFDAIDGTVSIVEGLSILGYSDPCLSAASELNPKLSPSTTFTAQRLATEQELDTKGNVSCADIVAMAPALYGSVWTSD